MLYKYLFSILCGHLNLNKKIEFGRLPVKPTGKPAGKLVQPTGKPVRTDCTAAFEFKFEFDRFRPVSGQTGPVYRNRIPPVWPDRSVSKTLGGGGVGWSSSSVPSRAWSLACRNENGRKQAEKPLSHFRFRFLLRKTRAGAKQPGTGAETEYNGYENGRKPKNLPGYIII